MTKSLNGEYSSEINKIKIESSTKIGIAYEKYTSELNKIKAEKEKLEDEIDRKTTCIICCEKYNDS